MAGEGQVIPCHTKDEWDAQLAKAKESGKLTVVDFTATWCGPCRMIAPYFTELAKNHTNIVFLKVDVDELNSVATEWGITAMPTFVFVKGGKEVDKVRGNNKVSLLNKIHTLGDMEQELKTPAAAATTSTAN